MKKIFKNRKDFTRGFTLVELMISVGIFALMTTFLLAKYGKFNQSVLLTNLAYDIALTIRNAQSYGLNVRSAPDGPENFDIAYGVHFATDLPSQYIFFLDADKNGVYTGTPQEKIAKYSIKRGSVIDFLCVANTPLQCSQVGGIDITFKRPNPDAIIKREGDTDTTFKYARITLRATDGSTKKIEIRSTGQIAVTN